jgi:hypothetical protein
MNPNSEVTVRLAKAMREAHGDHNNVAWENSVAKDEWLNIARAGLYELATIFCEQSADNNHH